MQIIIISFTVIFALHYAISFGQEFSQLGIFYKGEDINNNYEATVNPYNVSDGNDNQEGYCRTINNCKDCVNGSKYQCTWCHDVGCTGSTKKSCPYDQNQEKYVNLTAQDNRCPYISHAGPILLPADVRTNIKVNLFAPDPAINDKEILCELNVQQRLTHLKGIIMKNMVHCFPVTLNSKENGDIDTGLLRLLWDGADPYSNVLPVVIYKCENLAQDCNSCRMIPPEYGCGWCDIYNACILGDKCVNNFIKWALNRLSCDAFDRKLFYV